MNVGAVSQNQAHIRAFLEIPKDEPGFHDYIVKNYNFRKGTTDDRVYVSDNRWFLPDVVRLSDNKLFEAKYSQPDNGRSIYQGEMQSLVGKVVLYREVANVDVGVILRPWVSQSELFKAYSLLFRKLDTEVLFL